MLPGVLLRVVGLVLAENAGCALSPEHEYFVAIMYRPMAGARRWQRVTALPFVLRWVVYMVEIGVGVEAIDAAADDVDEIAKRQCSYMIAAGRQWSTLSPPVCLWVVDEMPIDRFFCLGGVTDGTADAVQQTDQNNAGDRATGCGQWGKALPAVRPDFVHQTLVMRPAVLLDEPSNGVQPTVQDGNTDVIRTARQRCGCRPAIAGRIVDVVIWPVNALLRVPTDQVQAARMCCCPGHFATGQRQRRLRHPAAGVGGSGRWTIEHMLCRSRLGFVDPSRLLQSSYRPP